VESSPTDMQKNKRSPIPRPGTIRSGAIRVLAALLAVLAPAAGAYFAAGAASETEPLRDMRFAQIERVQMVMVQATVTDKKGRPALGLKQEDFRLFDEGQPQEIEFFATENDAPISLAFLLDLSGSMRQPGRLDAAKAAIHSFLDAAEKADRFGLIGFADAQVTWITPFISDIPVFRKRLDIQRGYGQTALYDALAASPRLVDAEAESRKALVLFTDGLDNASQLSALEAIWLARQVSVPIYTISFISMPREMLSEENRQGLAELERFSRETGGALFAIHLPEDLQGAIERIQQDLRSQYVIGFTPGDFDASLPFRHLRVETSRSRLHVRTRTGYSPGS